MYTTNYNLHYTTHGKRFGEQLGLQSNGATAEIIFFFSIFDCEITLMGKRRDERGSRGKGNVGCWLSRGKEW